jgi:hypothetical protein
MLDRGITGPDIRSVFEYARRNVMVSREEAEDFAPDLVRIGADRVDLRPVAGREDEPFVDRFAKSPKPMCQRIAGEGELLANIHWSVFMVRSDDNDRWCRQGRDPVRSGELLFAAE